MFAIQLTDAFGNVLFIINIAAKDENEAYRKVEDVLFDVNPTFNLKVMK